MKPVAIFRHAAPEGPGFLADFLDGKGISWRLIAIDEGEIVPDAVDAYAGLVFMGGPMSVNGDLPWIAAACELVRQAVAKNVPVLGHCLGAQLISKALGAQVFKNAVKEIGWGEVTVANNEAARCWFNDLHAFDAFHWHGETFSLPAAATPLLSSLYCANQAYAIGPHLALQCHIEMTASMIENWCEIGADEVTASSQSPAVQSATLILQQSAEKLPGLHRVAEKLYEHWIAGLSQG